MRAFVSALATTFGVNGVVDLGERIRARVRNRARDSRR